MSMKSQCGKNTQQQQMADKTMDTYKICAVTEREIDVCDRWPILSATNGTASLSALSRRVEADAAAPSRDLIPPYVFSVREPARTLRTLWFIIWATIYVVIYSIVVLSLFMYDFHVIKENSDILCCVFYKRWKGWITII